MAGAEDEHVFRWDVTAGHIDLDRWARCAVELQLAQKEQRLARVSRFGFWPFYVVWGLFILVVALDSLVLAAAMLAFGAAGVLGARLWNRGQAARLARRLRSLPAASEPFTFEADPRGTHSRSASASEDLAWSHYRSAERNDDLLVLSLRNGTVRLLPVQSLTAPSDSDAALEAAVRWISAANQESADTTEA